jgi:hypothetical protein
MIGEKRTALDENLDHGQQLASALARMAIPAYRLVTTISSAKLIPG